MKNKKEYFILDDDDINKLSLLKKNIQKYSKLDLVQIAHIELKKHLRLNKNGKIN